MKFEEILTWDVTQGFSLTLAEQKVGPIAVKRFASIATRGHESINKLRCQEDGFILIY